MGAEAVRFWEGAAARHDDAPQADLERVLVALKDPEPCWATIDALLHRRVDGIEAWKVWQRALTALHATAPKRVQALRTAGHLIGDNPANAELRAAGWEPAVELARRLSAMAGANAWGSVRVDERSPACGACKAAAVWGAQACGACGGVVEPGRARWTWERTHDSGAQAGQAVRCFIDVHAANPAWARIRWASWREGLRAPKGPARTTAEAMGVDAEAVFGGGGP